MKVWQNERTPGGGATLWRFSLTYVCYLYKTCTHRLFVGTRNKRWIPAQLWVINTAPIRSIDLSDSARVPRATVGLPGSSGPHCDDSIDCNIIEKHTTAIYGENPGNRHPNPNNSVSPWQLMALLATAHREEDGSFQHMKSKPPNCTVSPALLEKVTPWGALVGGKNKAGQSTETRLRI